MYLNERLKTVRKKAGLTQAQLAEKLTISEATLKRYEKDASKIPVSIVSSVAIICDVDECWLFSGKNDENKDTSQTETTNLSKIVIEHQNLICKFRDPKSAFELTRDLVYIEREDPEGYKELLRETKTISKTVKRLKEKSKKIS